jgi:hypothetical protein
METRLRELLEKELDKQKEIFANEKNKGKKKIQL